MTVDPKDIARTISEQRKTLRYADRAFCPSDGRLVAAIVCVDGAKWVWTPGGRRGSHRDLLLKGIGGMARDIAGAQPQIGDATANRLRAIARDQLAEAIRTHARAETPPKAWPLAEITLEWSSETPCPGCSRQMRIEVDAAGALLVQPARSA